MRLRRADEKHDIKAKLLEITNDSNELLKVYQKLYEDLNDMYNNYGNVYKEIQKIVELPTNDDADRMTQLNQDLKEAIQYLSDESYLEKIMSGNSLIDDNYNNFDVNENSMEEEIPMDMGEEDPYASFFNDSDDGMGEDMDMEGEDSMEDMDFEGEDDSADEGEESDEGTDEDVDIDLDTEEEAE